MHKNTSITKKTNLTSMRAFLVFFGMLFMLNTYAYDFEKDGIYYNIVSTLCRYNIEKPIRNSNYIRKF